MGSKRLRRVLSFDDFAQALGVHEEGSELAEEEGHHPALLTEWAGRRSPGGRTRARACIATISSWRRKRTSYISHELIHCYELIRRWTGSRARCRGDGEVRTSGRKEHNLGRRTSGRSTDPSCPSCLSARAARRSRRPPPLGRDRALGRSPPKDAAVPSRRAPSRLSKASNWCRSR
jgi:Pterin 4 alpha carbinolamine dehydratase